jgi:hypothetical protein
LSPIEIVEIEVRHRQWIFREWMLYVSEYYNAYLRFLIAGPRNCCCVFVLLTTAKN